MEPTPQDLAAVESFMGGGQPQPTQPAQQQPAPVTTQTTPSQQANTDPFAVFSQPSEPTAPAQPVQPTQPTQPTEPVPTPQPQQPVEPSQPTPQAQPTQTQPVPVQPVQPTEPRTQTYEEYMNEVLGNVPQAPAQPDPSQVNPDDPESIKNFFDTLMSTAEQRFEANYARKQAIQNSEKRLWEQAFDKYASLRTNTELRGMVHAIRMDEFSKGRAITPTQAAEKLLAALNAQYRQGVADNQVVTTIEQVQPNGGGTTQVSTTADANQDLLAVQTGGEQALAEILEKQLRQQQ